MYYYFFYIKIILLLQTNFLSKNQLEIVFQADLVVSRLKQMVKESARSLYVKPQVNMPI